ncbi:MAG: hypothetical protein JW883_10540, partial [Deltaproteobacteria bacterium]|nr:hypothetical protein [Deltaproteobacteria bacterium]
LAAGMTRGASACAARRQGELRRNSALIPRLRGRSRYVAAKARSLLRGASFFQELHRSNKVNIFAFDFNALSPVKAESAAQELDNKVPLLGKGILIWRH